jgi:hypothetical protein
MCASCCSSLMKGIRRPTGHMPWSRAAGGRFLRKMVAQNSLVPGACNSFRATRGRPLRPKPPPALLPLTAAATGKLVIFCFFLFQSRLNKQPLWLIKQRLFEEVHSCFRRTLCASLFCYVMPSVWIPANAQKVSRRGPQELGTGLSRYQYLSWTLLSPFPILRHDRRLHRINRRFDRSQM